MPIFSTQAASRRSARSIIAPFLGAITGLMAAQAVADTTPSPFGIQEDLERLMPHLGDVSIESIVKMPIDGLVAIESEGQILFMSENGRYVMEARAHDLWQGIELSDIASVERSANQLNLARMGINAQTLNTLVIGEGPPDKNLTVFVDPFCQACMPYVEDLMASDWEFAVNIVVMPALGEASHEAAYRLACRNDDVSQEQALEALLTYSLDDIPAEVGCESVTYRSTLMLADSIGVDGVPFTIDGEGKVLRGVPDNLDYLLEVSR